MSGRSLLEIVTCQGGLFSRYTLSGWSLLKVYLRVISGLCGLSSGWSLFRVVSCQDSLSSWWSLISHQDGFASCRSLIRSVSPEAGLSFIRVVSGHAGLKDVSRQAGLSTSWSLVRPVSRHTGLWSGRPLVRYVSRQAGLSIVRVVFGSSVRSLTKEPPPPHCL